MLKEASGVPSSDGTGRAGMMMFDAENPDELQKRMQRLGIAS